MHEEQRDQQRLHRSDQKRDDRIEHAEVDVGDERLRHVIAIMAESTPSPMIMCSIASAEHRSAFHLDATEHGQRRRNRGGRPDEQERQSDGTALLR
jgi:hypothetical protein